MTLNSDPCSRSKASQREYRYLNDGVYSFPRFATSPLLMVGTFPPSRFSTFNLSGVKPSSSDLGKQRDQFSLVNLWARRNNSSDIWASPIILHQKHSAIKLVSVWEKPGCVLSALCISLKNSGQFGWRSFKKDGVRSHPNYLEALKSLKCYQLFLCFLGCSTSVNHQARSPGAPTSPLLHCLQIQWRKGGLQGLFLNYEVLSNKEESWGSRSAWKMPKLEQNLLKGDEWGCEDDFL